MSNTPDADNAGPRPDRSASLLAHSPSGVPIRIRFIREGESYGRTGALTAHADLVEFYDARYQHTDHGQFIERYHADSILGRNDWGSSTGGLILNTSQSNWELDAAQMTRIRTWVAERVAASYVEPTQATSSEDRLRSHERLNTPITTNPTAPRQGR